MTCAKKYNNNQIKRETRCPITTTKHSLKKGKEKRIFDLLQRLKTKLTKKNQMHLQENSRKVKGKRP